MDDKEDRLILYGAGRNGRLALDRYGQECVAFFCDNDPKKAGSRIEGVAVISFEEMLKMHDDGYVIMITPAVRSYLIEQLEQAGIYDYLIFDNDETRFPLKTNVETEEKYRDHNRLLMELVSESCKKEPLEDISALREISKEAKRLHFEENLMLAHYGFHSEGQYYGNMRVLLDYAGIKEEDISYFPEVSHADSMPVYYVDFMYRTAVIMSGVYYRNRIHKRTPWIPVFSVGPYIHYAQGIYSQEKVSELKRRNGRTLLAFLPHSIEGYEKKYSYKTFIDGILKIYGIKFDKIMVCVYWADTDSMACSYAQEKGMQVVSAGLRWDEKFDQRLKTLFELTDAVVCGDVGTFISYAVYMNKPIGRIDGEVEKDLYVMQLSDAEKTLGAGKEYLEFMSEYNRLFDSKLRIDPAHRKYMDPFAGFDQIRSIEYIKNISKISKDIWMRSEGDMRCYPEAVRQVYRKYEKQNDFCKMSMLREATGAFVD